MLLGHNIQHTLPYTTFHGCVILLGRLFLYTIAEMLFVCFSQVVFFCHGTYVFLLFYFSTSVDTKQDVMNKDGPKVLSLQKLFMPSQQNCADKVMGCTDNCSLDKCWTRLNRANNYWVLIPYSKLNAPWPVFGSILYVWCIALIYVCVLYNPL